ncbi:Man5GlcNac2-PP-Dol translocation protein Rft1 [Schizosaccharomyces cryophilus OY26]|uniref:Man(5)GlcNAc(2)-PP-dolichol translocation protein RFT1 n=1 Tax=Schizosaccharomyces cryophilus (strain OY26 / ATCC MYA-4695 / CBS 11777 / NBRC 106824 / NRRL Y48691) TaxID=653667 RepID=S9VRB9_SCHCR|nr:Man5GlcNac2-PP-Dol translocation protein Rft1 [Schizosaccharomyces cryophilus OY26]EPY50493.1 Man5GlcNac2-PP-Dol translocation protein Rft1 [Schizosaccharomyces cryophilus OY26]
MDEKVEGGSSSFSKMSASDSLLRSSSKGLGSSIFFQSISRGLTFVLNQLTIRFTSPQAYAYSSIHFEILRSTILFISRESVRLAMQRMPSQENCLEDTFKAPVPDSKYRSGRLQLVKNASVITVYAGIIVSILVAFFYMYAMPIFPYKTICILLYSFAGFLYLLSEPYYQILHWRRQFSPTASAEGLGIISNTVTSFLISFFSQSENLSVLPFAVGTLMESIVNFITLYSVANEKSLFIIPRRVLHEGKLVYWEDSFLRVISSHMFHLLLKHLMTKGDKIMIAWYATPSVQGPYALASNYGSLIARIVFRPLEEHSRIVFAQLTHSPEKQDRKKATVLLLWILKLYFYLTMFIIFGYNYSNIVLLFGAGKKWASDESASVLSWYAFYIPFMAANGVLEAFFVSTASSLQLLSQGRCFLLSTILYFVSGKVFLDWLSLGARGLVLANISNLLIRILFVIHFVHKNFPSLKFSESLPGLFISLLAGLFSAISRTLLHQFEIHNIRLLLFIASAPTLAIIYAVTILTLDKDISMLIMSRLKKPHKD